MQNYLELSHRLASNGLINQSDIYDYSKDELKDFYEQYFQFCVENLRINSDKYQIVPAFFYYERDFRFNAKATRKQDNFIIAVNMGLVYGLYNFFTDPRFDFEDGIFKKFQFFETELKISPEFLMYQIGTQFAYYHELAHLIQRSTYLDNELVEMYSVSEDFSLERHLLEIDADLWAAHHITYHLNQYFNKLSPRHRSNENLHNLFVLSSAAILTHFILLAANKFDIYFKKYTHPHPSIRISYIIDPFLLIPNKTFEGEFKLDSESVLVDAFELCEKIFTRKGHPPDYILGLFKDLNEQGIEVHQYISEMESEMHSRKHLLIDRYDELMK